MSVNEIMTLEEVAAYLRLKPQTIYTWAQEKKIPAAKEKIKNKVKKKLRPARYQRLRASEVRISNEVSDFFSVLEVTSATGVGKLFRLAKEIFSVGLDIRFARINTDEERMTGVFYVMDSEGQKIYEKDRIDYIKHRIIDTID